MRGTALGVGMLAFAALAAAPIEAASYRHGGVQVDIRTEPDRVTLCFRASQNVKIAAEYGVELTVPRSQQALWLEPMPKLVTEQRNYFDLPLRIDLRSVETRRARTMTAKLGACTDAKYCEPITMTLKISADNNKTDAPPCAPQR